jgi:hypothetical protein
MDTKRLETTSTKITVTVKDIRTQQFLVYDFASLDELKNRRDSKNDNNEIIYFVMLNDTCVYSYLMFRCLANYTEGLNWGKLLTIL